MSDLIERDERVVWHPFTQRGMGGESFPVVSARGTKLFLEDGRSVIDAISSWWCNTLGHGHPELVKAAAEQMARLDHVMFANFTHEPAVSLAEDLLSALPKGYGKVFFSDNGSTACEVALKLAVQLFHNRGEKRSRIAALQGAYHGDTFGAMAAGARGLFTKPFERMMFNVLYLAPEGGADEYATFEEACRKGDLAAFIFEPLLQGAGGMRMYSQSVLEEYLSIARRYGVVTIADEVMTGFGRLGPLFASSLLSRRPDIVCLSKGLTGGTLPLAVTVVDDALASEFVSPDHSRTFFHGHTYTGNPTACAVARRAVALTQSAECEAARARIESTHRSFAQVLEGSAAVTNVRVLGTVLAFDRVAALKGYDSTSARGVADYFIRRGVLVRPLGEVLYVLPPYCITDEELGEVYRAIEEFLGV
jgi:adenosylmethionine-8-amino-7-oxononanoate aminotransferase